jgi:signal peptidase II
MLPISFGSLRSSDVAEFTVPVTIRRLVLFWSIAVVGACFDLSTKTAIFAMVGEPPAPPRRLVANILELRTSFNPGGLWGFGREMSFSSPIFGSLAIVAALGICYYLFVYGAAVSRGHTITLALIMAGALGNGYDRLALGHVRDFVYFHVDSIGFDIPIFNFADNMLIIGAVSLMLLALRPDSRPVPAKPDRPESTRPVGDALEYSSL